MGKSMRVYPVIVVVSLLAGAQIAGFVGIILSVPLAVLVQEIFNYLTERKEVPRCSICKGLIPRL